MESTLGTIAMITGLLMTFLGLPGQILKTWKSKSANDLSLFMWGMGFANVVAWTSYGLFREEPDWYLVIPNAFGLLFVAVILFQIFHYGKKKQNVPTDSHSPKSKK
ncbi:SemiSWEET family sugar transporter [Pelagicoccus mobilis]|uniref:MtN3 and saliva related transmembrane protein n=1 Tax=Pelagicoccus mobilis TaxID=415221 RepID=A0A934RS18_9BACT|nr:SemiSWEET family transporter [Pelagicoccus mobilis]MBK1875306.1 hypothetical protein [Pelagicoccus mobilis]